jgi:hypothetical protein
VQKPPVKNDPFDPFGAPAQSSNQNAQNDIFNVNF